MGTILLYQPYRDILLPILIILAFTTAGESLSQDKAKHPIQILSSSRKLLREAEDLLDQYKPDQAMEKLLAVYAVEPESKAGLNSLLERCLIQKCEADETNVMDRLGLASLYIDQEKHQKAALPLKEILAFQPNHEFANCQLFQVNAACCNWESYQEESERLKNSLRLHVGTNNASSETVPALHPFSALKWPCISLEEAAEVARRYSFRSMKAVNATTDIQNNRKSTLYQSIEISPKTNEGLRSGRTSRKVRLGYISPDFTSKHPLAFLMQAVFEMHDREIFEVITYSLGNLDSGKETTRIKNGSDRIVEIPSATPSVKASDIIREDKLDILVDLCGFAGTSRLSEIMALRPAPVQVSYMGFPSTTGAPFIDYMVCDRVVVPPEKRQHYTEKLIYLPHSYFVNSHAHIPDLSRLSASEKIQAKAQYGLPLDHFVFCCHNRATKIDPCTYFTWMQALKEVKNHGGKSVLWLLRSGSEMEENLRNIAVKQYGLEKSDLIFCDIAPRTEHLRRLGCADLFLDTPAYNAHTVGCDSLFAGVPLLTLLCDQDNDTEACISTEKLPSRVGASILYAAGLDEMVCSSLSDYKDRMVKCATEQRSWFDKEIKARLDKHLNQLPLFDTRRWVRNFETALQFICLEGSNSDSLTDFHVLDTRK